MPKEKRTNNALLRRKLKIEQHEPHWKPSVNSCAPKGFVVPTPLVVYVILSMILVIMFISFGLKWFVCNKDGYRSYMWLHILYVTYYSRSSCYTGPPMEILQGGTMLFCIPVTCSDFSQNWRFEVIIFSK